MRLSFILAGMIPFFLIPCFAVSADAQSQSVNLGMSSSQVVAQWGEPKEKIMKETRRIQVWNYSEERSVVLSEGVVTQVKSPGEKNAQKESSPSIDPVEQSEAVEKAPPVSSLLAPRPEDASFDLSSALSEIGDGDADSQKKPSPGSRRNLRRK